MPADIVEAIIPFLAATLLAWMQSGLAYGVFRWGESKWHLLPYVAFLPLATYFFYTLISLDGNPMSSVLVVGFLFTLVAMLGGWFHRRSGGASRHWLGAFALVFDATLISLAITFFVMVSIIPPVKLSVPRQALEAYSFGTTYYPALVPLAIWILKSLRLRPGIDVPS
jgi:hypothetical protein